MTTIASVQVRLGSSRLPGKALMEVAGKPLLGHLLDRLTHAQKLDGVVVATGATEENDPIAEYCAGRQIPCFRGSEVDVLGRTLGALEMMAATVGVEVFGDCPLIDPAIVDQMVAVFQNAGGAYDFVSNDLATTYPPGMEVEVFKVSALADAARRVTDPATREHGTLFLRQNPDLYRLLNVEAPPEHRHPDLELEVDTLEDVTVIRAVLERFQAESRFTLDDVIRFMRAHPEITQLNADLPRRWKAFRASNA